MTSFSIQSFGCRANQAEAFLWTDEFQHFGLNYCGDLSKSDLILINSCTLTSRADRDVRKFIRRIGRVNPNARLIVTGCFADRAKRELEAFPQVWKVFDNRHKADISAEVLSGLKKNKDVVPVPFRSRPLIKIQEGCDFSCSFCIIPSVRGTSRSVIRETIVSQAQEYFSRGFEEIILTGINLCLFGRDLQPETSLLELLKDLEGLEGQGWFRLSSLDPRFLDPEQLSFLVKSSAICPFFHLSLQHGSDRILARMGRKITVSRYREVLDFLREKLPDAALGTDIIVGFPGETEEDFAAMADFLKTSPLTYFHVFSFSPRPGTQAAEWPQVKEAEKKQRGEILLQLAREKNLEFRRRLVGKTIKAVVINKKPGKTKLLTGNYIKVEVPVCPAPESSLVLVRIDSLDGLNTLGEIS